MRGATKHCKTLSPAKQISIHTPLAGSDHVHSEIHTARDISIHTPLAGSDPAIRCVPPVRCDFNPHSPCGERRLHIPLARAKAEISIHTPLAGSDRRLRAHHPHPLISIHTPLAGSDLILTRPPPDWGLISIHTPLAGSDRKRNLLLVMSQRFQSTLPLRGATKPRVSVHTWIRISIHTPLAGSDNYAWSRRRRRTNFNPHSPCGERPQK